ncbi:MAG: hypothetical protein ACT4OP_06370 [Actinomycetota bacterium]
MIDSPEVPVAALVERLQRLDPGVNLIGLAKEGSSVIEAMFDQLGEDEDALASFQPVSDAIKQVVGGLISRSIDRDQLATLALPMVVRRASLERALTNPQPRTLADMTAVIAARGRVGLFRRPDDAT